MSHFTSYADKFRVKRLGQGSDTILDDSDGQSQNESTVGISAMTQITTSSLTTVFDRIVFSESETQERRRQFFDRERVNLDSHQLLWCDSNISGLTENTGSTVTINELRKIVDYTKLFDNVDECHQFIKQTGDTITFLICSAQFAECLIPYIHDLKNVKSIYVYCPNNQSQWSTKSSKIKMYFDCQSLLRDNPCMGALLSDISDDVVAYLKQEKTANMFDVIGKQERTADNNYEYWWSNLIRIVCCLPYPDTCLQTFLTTLRNYYQKNESTLRMLDKFERDYTSEKAVWWYTGDTFIYRLLNKALRQHNIEVMFLFGFYIKDVYIQLEKEYEKLKTNYSDMQTFKVYRGQLMSVDEVELLQYSQDTDIIVNSFFSTSLNRSVASIFLNPLVNQDDQLKSVLFEIELHTKTQYCSFGYVSHLSSFPVEKEILIMIGTSLVVKKVSYENDTNSYLIQLTLSHDPQSEKNVGLTVTSMKEELERCLTNAVSLTSGMGAVELNSIISELSHLFPTEKVWFDSLKNRCISICLYETWYNYIDAEDYGTAYAEAFVCFRIGVWFQETLKNNTVANEHYDEALTIDAFSPLETLTQTQRIKLYGVFVNIYKYKIEMSHDEIEKRDYTLNVNKYKKLQSEEMVKYSSREYIAIAHRLTGLGDLQRSMHLFDEALANYEKTIEFLLVLNQFDKIAVIYENICQIYTGWKADYTSALTFKLKELEYLVKYKANSTVLQSDAMKGVFKLAECHHELSDIYFKLNQFQSAFDHLAKAKQIYQDNNYYFSKTKISELEEKMRNIEVLLSQQIQ